MTDGTPATFDALRTAGSDLAAVTRLTSQLEQASPEAQILRFGLSGNVTLDLLGTFLRKQAVLHGQRADVRVGAFDDHVGGVRSLAEAGVDALLILDLFDALIPAFEARVETIGGDVLNDRLDRYRTEIALTLSAAASIRHVFLGLLHPLAGPSPDGPEGAIAGAVAAFNAMLVEEASRHPNVAVIDTAALCARIGWSAALDLRSYRRFRAPFASPMLDALAGHLFRRTRGFGTYFYKALVMDADGALWGGMIGEDLLSGIQLDPNTAPGSIYWGVQHQILALHNHGVLLAICSKNDQRDVDEVLSDHPNEVLRNDHFAVKRIDWTDKPTNLRLIAGELGIGLDALIFVDDSPFEVEAVKSQLPTVRTFQVPGDLSLYPALVSEIRELFAVESLSAESSDKTAQYRMRDLAAAERGHHESQESYLESLGIKLTIARDDLPSAGRIAELTQKSNQFNLTTRRRTEAEILGLMAAPESEVYSLRVEDRFGDSGLTGVAIMAYEAAGVALVDTFLLSCRVLGRDIELACWPTIIGAIRSRGCRTLAAEYVPTNKNEQVRSFWERLGLSRVSVDADGNRTFQLDLDPAPVLIAPSYVEVISAL